MRANCRHIPVMGIYILLIVISLAIESESHYVNPDSFKQKLKELAEKAGFTKIQDVYNSKQYSNSQVSGQGLVNEVASSLGVKFNGPIEAARKIKLAVEASEDSFTSSPTMPKCCEVYSGSFNSKFRTQVDFDKACIRVASEATTGAKYPHSNIMNVMKQNYEDNPSLKWQYFASEDGHYVNYPALKTKYCGDYDARFRPFYVETATPMPKDVVVIIDRSGSMVHNTHQGKTLMQIAKEAAISVVETLNPNDRVSVVAFETNAMILGVSERSCLNDELAMATPKNKKFLSDAIRGVTAGLATNYEAALNKAFDVFSRSTIMNNSSIREQVILFLTDGRKTEGGDPVQVIADRNKKLNNKIIVFTYALGKAFEDADKTILEDMANQVKTDSSIGAVKKGLFTQITDPSKLRSAMASYYSRFSSSEQLTNAIFSVPYQDLLGIGLLTSICLPVYKKSGSLFGVACSDVTMEDLLATLTYFQAGDLAYSFIIDGTGRTLMHPLMPQPAAASDDPLFINIKHLERSSQASEFIYPMIMGQSGNKKLNVKRIFSRGNVIYDGIGTQNMEATFHWTPVGNSNFSIAVVVATDDTIATLKATTNQPEAVHYHRLDLLNPGNKACKHFNRYAVKDFSTIMLTPKAFKDPYKYLDTTESHDEVYAYERFLKGETATNPGLKQTIKESVIATYGAEQQWKNSDIDSNVVWQYIGTKDGVMRLYPGVTLPKNYDHTRRPWYLRTVAMKGKYVFSAPYKDQWGSGNLITMSKTITQESQQSKPIMGVMGTDFRLTQFYQLLYSSYTECQGMHSCFLVDSSGYIVIHKDFVLSSSGDPKIENVHIVYKEPAIAKDMIDNSFMTRSNCLDLENNKNQFTYRIHLTPNKDRLSSPAKYIIYFISETNMYLVVKEILEPAPKVTCCSEYNTSPDKRLCVSSRQCDCVCHTNMDNFNYCLNEYALLSDAAPTCSPQPPTLLPLPVNEENLVHNLGVCVDYKCSEQISRQTCNSIVGCDFCFRDQAGYSLSVHFCGTVYQCRLGITSKAVQPPCDNCEDGSGSVGGIVGGVMAVVVVAIVAVIVGVYLKRTGKICKDSSSSTARSNNTAMSSSVNSNTNPAFVSGFSVNQGNQFNIITEPTAPPPSVDAPPSYDSLHHY